MKFVKFSAFFGMKIVFICLKICSLQASALNFCYSWSLISKASAFLCNFLYFDAIVLRFHGKTLLKKIQVHFHLEVFPLPVTFSILAIL